MAFESINGGEGGGARRGFKYTDTDGDSLRAWRWVGGDLYIKTADSEGRVGGTVRMPVADIDQLIEKLERLKKSTCGTCSGEGVV
jgi:hypothetical protein